MSCFLLEPARMIKILHASSAPQYVVSFLEHHKSYTFLRVKHHDIRKLPGHLPPATSRLYHAANPLFRQNTHRAGRDLPRAPRGRPHAALHLAVRGGESRAVVKPKENPARLGARSITTTQVTEAEPASTTSTSSSTYSHTPRWRRFCARTPDAETPTRYYVRQREWMLFCTPIFQPPHHTPVRSPFVVTVTCMNV